MKLPLIKRFHTGIAFLLAFMASLAQAAFGASSPCLHVDGRLGSGVNTYAAAVTDSSKLVGELFSKILMLQAKNMDALGAMEGPEGSGKPIITKTDLSKGAGNTVNFSVAARPGGRGTQGETALEAERIKLGSYPITVDFLRKGFALNDKIETFLAAGRDLKTAFALMAGEWFALQRQADVFMLWRRFADGTNTYRPNSRASTDTLLSTDYFKSADISEVAGLLKSRGAPAPIVTKRNVSVAGSSEVKGYIVLGSDRFFNSMKTTDSSYQNALQNAGLRGNENVIWSGGYADWDGNKVFHMDSVQEDTQGPLGLAIEPEALLGTALSAGTTARTITGGGITGPDTTSYFPFEWFKGNPYPLLGYSAPSADSSVYYVVIYNVSGASAGKFGIYQYTGSNNNGNTIVCSAHLGASVAGVQVTTLANIPYDAAKHTTDHPSGSRIIQVNAKCVPYCYGAGLAEGAALRPYGGPPITPISEEGDWGFKKGIGMQAIYGTGLMKDTANVARRFCLIEAPYRPIGCTNLPNVTS